MVKKRAIYIAAFVLVLAASLTLAQKARHRRAGTNRETATQSLSITVTSTAPPPLAISTTTLPDGKVGESYSSTLAATGGTPPYNWAVTTGTLPDGLLLDGVSGTIAGNPTQAQSKTFTVTVTDSGGGVPPQPPGDISIIVIPNPTFSINDGQSKPLSAIGNVTNTPISVTWTISPSNGNATLSATSGSSTTFVCGSNGHTGSPYTITATAAGLTAGTTSGGCLAVGSETIINSADCSAAALSAAWGQMTSGTYVIQLPSPCPGSSGIYTSQWSPGAPPAAVTSITLRGGTNVNCTGTAGTSSYACAATDNSVIVDNDGTNQDLLDITINGNGTYFRMTGLTVRSGTGVAKNDGLIVFHGGSHNFRIDHNHFTMIAATQYTGKIYGDTQGVIDHNLFTLGGSSSYSQGFFISNPIGDNIGNADGGWAKPTGFGTDAFLFMENNQYDGGWSEDCASGGKFVARYNTFNNMNEAIHNHGTKSDAGAIRGCRAFEVYHNYFAGATSGGAVAPAAIGSVIGPELIWGNTFASGFYNFMAIGVERSSGAQPETPTPSGWGYCGTKVNGTGSNWDGNSVASTGYPCLDGIGRGMTQQALNGQWFPSRLNSSTGTIAWPRQFLEPTYFWDNSVWSSANFGYTNDYVTVSNRDYYFDCNSLNSSCSGGFTGAAGTGTGVLASRPSTCTAGPGGTYGTSPTGSYGVAYFATDALGGNGVLYVCTSTNVWTNIYTPYTYPHPLTAVAEFAAPFDWTPVIWIALLVLAVAVYFLRKPILKRFKKGPDA
jgi:hypothetical protein